MKYLLLFLLTVTANAQIGRETTYTRSLKTNTTAASWRTALGLDGSGEYGGATNYPSTIERREFETDFTYAINQNPWNPTLSGWRPSFLLAGDSALTNSWRITNGHLENPRLSGTNLPTYYLSKATLKPVLGAKARIRFSTNDASDYGLNLSYNVVHRTAYILVNQTPLVTGVGISGWFLHLAFNGMAFSGELYTNGLGGLYSGEGTNRPASWGTVDAGTDYAPHGQVMEIGFEMISTNTMNVFCGGRVVKTWTLDGFTNLFHPKTGLGTNIVFESFVNDSTNFMLGAEFVSMSYWTDGYRQSPPLGIKANLNSAGVQSPPDLAIRTISIDSGTNNRAGNITLVGGTVSNANNTVTANTLVLFSRKTAGGTVGTSLSYEVTAGAGFRITSQNALETSVLSYLLIENP